MIIGASGILGQVLARRAPEAGKAVQAFSRHPEGHLAEVKAPGAEVVASHLRDSASLR